MRNFEYFRPDTIEEACFLLSKYKEEAKVIAGGQSLLILMEERLVNPSYLIDIKEIPDLDYISYDPKEGLKIGVLATHRQIETSNLIQERFSLLSEMEKKVASVQIRNMGTLGGNLCHADPCGDVAPPLIGMGARVKIVSSRGERSILLEGFFTDYFETVLEADEILAKIQIPNLPPYTGGIYLKHNLREVDPAVVGVAAVITADPLRGICQDLKIVLAACASTPMRAKRAEGALKEKQVEENRIKEASQIASEEANPISDLGGSEGYKREMVKILTEEAIKRAWDRAKSN